MNVIEVAQTLSIGKNAGVENKLAHSDLKKKNLSIGANNKIGKCRF